jgi:hypothetical protein
MPGSILPSQRRDGALALIRSLRNIEMSIGVRHSGIALDVAMLMFERADRPLTVKEVCRLSGYSGPTVRLVITRLTSAGTVAAAGRIGRTTAYRLTPRGIAGLDAYVACIWDFAAAAARDDLAGFIAAAATIPVPGRRGGRTPLRARYADGPPDREGAE